MTDWTNATPAQIAEALRTALLLPGEPVGVRLFDDTEAFDAWDAPHPEVPVHYCAAVRMASAGDALKLARADISCDTSPRTLGLEPGFDDPEFTESYIAGGLYRDLDVANAVLADVVTLRDTVGVVVAPLGHFGRPAPPDVVIVGTNPYGVMRVTQAAGFHGLRLRSDAIGMHGICAESTALPHATGEIGVSLLCSGTRYVAQWGDDMMSVGIPWSHLPLLADGLLRTADRYETDERKDRMRSACRRVDGGSGCVAREVESLTAGAGYFCEG